MEMSKIDRVIKECIERTLHASPEERKRMEEIYDKHIMSSTNQEDSDFKFIFPIEDDFQAEYIELSKDVSIGTKDYSISEVQINYNKSTNELLIA